MNCGPGQQAAEREDQPHRVRRDAEAVGQAGADAGDPAVVARTDEGTGGGRCRGHASIVPRAGRRNQPRDGDLREESGCIGHAATRALRGRRRRRSGRRSPARRGTAAGSGRSRRRRCRGRRSRRSGRSARPAFGRSSRPSRCASSWREPNEPDTWIATSASGRSIEKFATLETTSRPTSPDRNASKSRCRSLTGVSPLITGASRSAAISSSWSRYCPMTSVGSPACCGDELLGDPGLGGGAGGEPVALLGLGGGVGQPLALAEQGHPHLDAVGRRDPALRLDVLPRGVVPLRARSARTRRPRGRPRGPGSRSARSGGGPAGWRSSGRSARAAGAPRRRRSGPSRGRRAARGGE